MNRDLINRAKDFAHWAHDAVEQKRKYTGEPYWHHTDAVAALVEEDGGTDEMIAAAHLHDTLEDVEPVLIKQGRVADLRKFQTVFYDFPAPVRDMVVELTHLYTAEEYPTWSRAERKNAEADRLGSVSNNSKTIKVYDLIHNTVSIVEYAPEFAKVYLREKADLLRQLKGASPAALMRAEKQLRDSLDKLGQI